jgi:purine-binding chemotaxis protein CheW
VSEPRGAISRRAKPARAEPSQREYLAFEVGAARYALPLQRVREIVRVPEVTEVPRAPAHVLGVISVRGAVTTVFDLRVKLRMNARPATPKSRILLVEDDGETVGLLVDNVLQVYRLHDVEIELASVLGAEAPPYLFGIGRPVDAGEPSAGREFLLLLDAGALLRQRGHDQA